MTVQPNVIGGLGIIAYQELIDTVTNLITPLGLATSDTLATFLAALATVRDQQGA